MRRLMTQRIPTPTHTYIHTHTHINTHTHTYAHIHTYTHSLTHAPPHTHTHTQTYSRLCYVVNDSCMPGCYVTAVYPPTHEHEQSKNSWAVGV